MRGPDPPPILEQNPYNSNGKNGVWSGNPHFKWDLSEKVKKKSSLAPKNGGGSFSVTKKSKKYYMCNRGEPFKRMGGQSNVFWGMPKKNWTPIFRQTPLKMGVCPPQPFISRQKTGFRDPRFPLHIKLGRRKKLLTEKKPHFLSKKGSKNEVRKYNIEI